jgi:COMPASS component SWD3
VYDIGDTKNSYLLQKLEGHKDKVFAVQFHPKEPTIASCSADHTIKLWHCNADNDGYFLHLNNNYY